MSSSDSSTNRMSSPVLRILSWNIDGLNPKYLKERTTSILQLILQNTPLPLPDVLFFQECIHENLALLKNILSKNGYTLIGNNDSLVHYFTIAFVRTNTVKVNQVQRIPFKSLAKSSMGRDILSVECSLHSQLNTNMKLLTSHLESCREASVVRIEQLFQILQHMTTSHRDKNYSTLLAGDLNLRDAELKAVLKRLDASSFSSCYL